MSHGSGPEGDTLKLDQFLKLRGITATGGQAKLLIQSGDVRVNGAPETRRRRKLVIGDVVEVAGECYPVAKTSGQEDSRAEI